jgi:hypothetical protein
MSAFCGAIGGLSGTGQQKPPDLDLQFDPRLVTLSATLRLPRDMTQSTVDIDRWHGLCPTIGDCNPPPSSS